jgi:rSAM/selenodomain-associated transferase 2
MDRNGKEGFSCQSAMNCSFSVIIPVLHESSIINRAIDHIRDIRSGFDVEIIVVDGDPEGSTIFSITDEKAAKLVSQKARGKQMNEGASLAKGNILLFLHADTGLPENAFALIAEAMDKKKYTGGAFELGINSDRRVFRLTEQFVSIRTHLTRIPYGDQAIFIRREVFDRLNGFKEIPIMEDVDLMWRIKKAGDKIYIIPEKVTTSPRRWEREGILYCTLRNWIIVILYLLGAKPEKLARHYYPD